MLLSRRCHLYLYLLCPFLAICACRYKFAIFKVNFESFQLEMDKTGPPSATARDFAAALPASEARYAVYDHTYTAKSGMKADKLYFVLWTPGSASSKDKMAYASQRHSLDGVFTGVEEMQAAKLDQVLSVFDPAASAGDDDEWDPDA